MTALEALAGIVTGAEAERHRQMAQRFAGEALNAPRQLEARNALSKFDRKSLGKLQAAAEKYATELGPPSE